MSRVSATPAGLATVRMADYYTEFARGGFGLVITEGTYTDAGYSQGYRNQPGLATAEHAADGARSSTGCTPRAAGWWPN